MRNPRPHGMVFAAAVALCLLSHTLAAADRSKKDCTLKRVGSVEFTITDNGILTPVTVNDHPARMILSTASIMTVMWSDAAGPVGATVSPLPVNSAEVKFGAFTVTQFAAVPSFALGPVQFGKAQFVLVPRLTRRERLGEDPIVGELGMDAFGKLDFELDFANHRLNLYSQDHCPGSVVYWTDSYSSATITKGQLGNFYFPMELDGKNVEATVSTTARVNTLPTDVTKQVYGFDEHSADIETEVSTSGAPVAHYRAMALTASGLQVTNARIQLDTEKRESCSLTTTTGKEHAAIHEGCLGGEAPLMLGLSVVEHMHLYFATKERILYFTDANASH